MTSILEQRRGKGVITAGIMLLLLYVISAEFYHHEEGWSYTDCVYFVTMTITTIGYGDFAPQTDNGKIYSIFLAFTGISLAFYLIASIAFIREKAIDVHLHRKLNIIKDMTRLKRGRAVNEEIGRKLGQ